LRQALQDPPQPVLRLQQPHGRECPPAEACRHPRSGTDPPQDGEALGHGLRLAVAVDPAIEEPRFPRHPAQPSAGKGAEAASGGEEFGGPQRAFALVVDLLQPKDHPTVRLDERATQERCAQPGREVPEQAGFIGGQLAPAVVDEVGRLCAGALCGLLDRRPREVSALHDGGSSQAGNRTVREERVVLQVLALDVDDRQDGPAHGHAHRGPQRGSVHDPHGTRGFAHGWHCA
jgi:hypothetical protein